MAFLTEIQEQEATSAYDVFLSFRGRDTRLAFIDHLHQALINENINTFLDEEEVETGEELKPELERAIKSSRAYIIVLSENYASSAWCLDELVMILEQRRTSKHTVLPIFYHVEPTHVRKQEGSFGEALTVHKQRMEAEKDQEKKSQRACKLELWTEALTEVADLKGKDASGRRETLFIEEIAKEISNRLGLHLQTNIPRLIGMEFSIHTISSWVKEKSSKTGAILTIWGMAGIGKTSLAEYIYRLHYHEFERSSFLEGIERKCAEQSSALLDLQKQLLGDVLKKSMIDLSDVNVCTAKLEKALFEKQSLVVLDGIDKFEQLDVLIGTKGFHPGTKIIITTKDGSLTQKCASFRTAYPPEHKKHKLSGLNCTESKRLLCRHAFGADVPKEGYEEEVERVVKYCGGHPLALKVLGSSLINEDADTWIDIFELLKTKEFYTDLENVLRISFDSLPSDNCKELFKHIACFFVGEDKNVTEATLKECGIRTSCGIAKLVDRCLLMISEDNKLMMHQLVQEMGRDLVRQESPMKPWKRSRLWNHQECFILLKENKGTTNVQALFLDMKMLEREQLGYSSSVTEDKFQDDLNKNLRVPLIHRVYEFFSNIWGVFSWIFLMFWSSCSKKVELRTNVLGRMDNLKLLQLNHVKLNGSYENFPKGLRWLCMHGFRMKYIPLELPTENLVALDMSYSNLKQLWKKPKLLRSLKILNVSYSNIVRVGGFGGLPSLERLILEGCANLIQVCESIGGCDRLVLLDMSYCNKLKKIPSSIGKLKKLEILSINCCTGVSEFPVQSMNVDSLKERKEDSISSKSYGSLSSNTKPVPRSPKSFLLSLPASLVRLSLVDINLFVESFPMDFSSMSKLMELFLDGNPIHSLPDCVRSLSKLEKLSLERCFMLKSVLFPPSTLRYLSIDSCLLLEKITYHSEMSRPPSVFHRDAKSLKEIDGLIKFQDFTEVGEELLSGLGWTDFQYVKDQKVLILIYPNLNHATRVPVQVCYEFGIFSIYFVGKEVPNWFAHRSNGSSISFTMPSCPMNKSMKALNICFVHTPLSTHRYSFLLIKIRNITKSRTWMYWAYTTVVVQVEEEIVWLSHWMFGNNELEDGDEVIVSIFENMEGGLIVKECAVSPMYDDRDMNADPLGYYKSWKHIIGRDLSDYELTSGDYFLFHFRSMTLQFAKEFRERFVPFQNHLVRKFIGYIPYYKDLAETAI